MSVYLLTGKLGGGKTLGAVARAVDYASRGRRVVSNFHLDLSSVAHKRASKLARATVEIIAPRPTSHDLVSLGRGGASEHCAGLLILDECATFLNSRQWMGGDRPAVIEWFLHSRKLGWDIILIVQHASMLDKQIREAIGEFLVTVRRLDKMRIPIISWFFPVPMPQVHIAQVRYGLGPNDMTADHWVFRGKKLYQCYNTEWISEAGDFAPYCTLSAELTRFRYSKPFPWRFVVSLAWRVPFYLVCRGFERSGLLRRSHFMVQR